MIEAGHPPLEASEELIFRPPTPSEAEEPDLGDKTSVVKISRITRGADGRP